MTFEIINVDPVTNGTLRAFFTVEVGMMIIEGWTYHEKDDKSWICPPEGPKTITGISFIRFPWKEKGLEFEKFAKDEVICQINKIK